MGILLHMQSLGTQLAHSGALIACLQYTICSCVQAAAHKRMQAERIKVHKASLSLWWEVAESGVDVQMWFVYLDMLVL